MNFKNQDELIHDLAYKGRFLEVVFILGSGLTVPAANRKGVPSAKTMISRLEAVINNDGGEELKGRFASQFFDSPSRDYRAVFKFLSDQKFPEAITARTVRAAVLEAYDPRDSLMDGVLEGNKDACIEVELDRRWDLRPGL